MVFHITFNMCFTEQKNMGNLLNSHKNCFWFHNSFLVYFLYLEFLETLSEKTGSVPEAFLDNDLFVSLHPG